MFRLKYEEMIEWIPNKIFGSNTGSFDRSADQTASGYVNTPINNNHIITTLGFSQIFIKWKIMIGGKILEGRELRIERDQAAPRTETPMAMAIPMAEKV